MSWNEISKCSPYAIFFADRHYSRGKIGSKEIGPPGQKIVLLSTDGRALWGSHRPAPWCGIKRMDGFEGHSCFIYRNEGSQTLSSILIRDAVAFTAHKWGIAPFLTYVAVNKVQSINPGFCFIKAGFDSVGYRDKTKHGRMRKLIMPAYEVERCLSAWLYS